LPPAQLTLVPRDLTIPYNTTTRSLSSVQLTEPARGRFEINGVVPGKYDLFASVTNANAVAGALNETRYFAGRVAVDVGLQNLENVSVAVGQPLPLKIRVTVNGSSTIPPETIRVQAQPADASFSVGAYTSNSPVGLVAVDAQGELTIPSLHEALYRFQVLFSPYSSARPSVATDFANVYVDDIRQGGISVYDSGVEVSKRDLGPVEMLVKTNGGAIDGIVNDALGVGQPGVAVVLAPPENRRRNPALYKTVTTTAAGRFSIRGIPPGSYELFAWPSVPTGAYQSPEFIAKDEQRGRQVLVNASSTTTVDLNLITPALR
jgi:hypothetical protein